MILRYSHEAKQRIQTLSPEIKRGLRGLLEGLSENPYLGKPLQRELEGYWSIAFKRYRIIYKIITSKKEILIYTVGHRKNVYGEARKVKD